MSVGVFVLVHFALPSLYLDGCCTFSSGPGVETLDVTKMTDSSCGTVNTMLVPDFTREQYIIMETVLGFILHIVLTFSHICSSLHRSSHNVFSSILSTVPPCGPGRSGQI